MTQPTAYNRLVNFVAYALAHTAAPYNASDHDSELDAIETTLDETLANLRLIQRDDGKLANESVHPDALSSATLLLIEAAGSASGLAGLVKGSWLTSTAYAKGEIVQNSNTSYVCAVAHTSGTFNTDYSAGKWIVLGATASNTASTVSFTPAGNIAAVTVQAAIEELDAEKAATAGNSSNQFSVNDASSANHAVTMGQIQKNNLVTAAGGGTADAITATIGSGLVALVDGMTFIIESPGTNTITNPTLNLTLGSTATGAKTIVKGNNTALVAGDIVAGKCQFCYDSSLVKWVLINPVYPSSTLPVANGGTGGGTASDARTGLGVAYGPAFSAYASADQTGISSGIATKITLDTEEYDTATCFAAGRFTATVAGYYQINGSVKGNSATLTEIIASIFRNGSLYHSGTADQFNSTNGSKTGVVATLVYLGVGDYVELYGTVTGGTPKFAFTSTGNTSRLQGFLARYP